LVDGQVVVEAKALSHQLTNDELAQVIQLPEGLRHGSWIAVQLRRRKLEYRRVFPAKSIIPVQRIGRDDILKMKFIRMCTRPIHESDLNNRIRTPLPVQFVYSLKIRGWK